MSRSLAKRAKQSAGSEACLTIRIPKDLKATLRRISRGERRSMSAQAIIFLEEGVSNLEKAS